MGNTIIEINGKRYDARSGELLGEGTKPVSHAAQSVQRRGRAIDGIVKSTQATIKPIAHASAAQATTNHTAVKSVATLSSNGKVMEPVSKRHRKPASLTAAHKPEKSKTLMRHAVRKPNVAKKTSIKTQAPTEIAAAPVSSLTPHLKKSAENVDEKRLARARQVDRSQQVQRFTNVQQNHPVTRSRSNTQYNDTRRAQVAQPARPPRHSENTSVAPGHNTAHNTQPPHSQHHTPRHADLFEAAIANARAHEQPRHKPKRTARQRALNITAGFAAFLVLAGFVAYLNMSTIEVRVASVRAGFSAQLPSYAPTGYARAGLEAKYGIVMATYRSGASSYTLQQQTSDWDSQTLYDNVVASADEKSETVSGQGRTIYVYGDKAAWVNGGVLYSIKTQGDISSKEILSIATSM